MMTETKGSDDVRIGSDNSSLRLLFAIATIVAGYLAGRALALR